MVSTSEVAAHAHGGLLDVSEVSMVELVKSGNTILIACIERLRASLLSDPSGVLSAFQSVVD